VLSAIVRLLVARTEVGIEARSEDGSRGALLSPVTVNVFRRRQFARPA
jgi:hypothetical protein